MIRKLLLPAAAMALLGGCVSAGYSYRHGSGDYYYGAPSVEYRYYGGTSYGWPYPYGYGASPYGYGYGYGYPYGYQYYGDPYRYYYGSPYGTRYYRQPVRVQPRVDPTPDRPRSHWRDLSRRNHPVQSQPIGSFPSAAPQRQPEPRSIPAPPSDAGMVTGRVRRAKQGAGGD